MRLQTVALLSVVLTSHGCGDDVSSNKAKATLTSKTEGQTTSTSTAQVGSGINRSRGVKQLSYSEEIKGMASNNLASIYRIIPDMELDDEGEDMKSVFSRTHLSRPKSSCGIRPELKGIQQRIQDCLAVNGDQATWDGTLYGSSTEGKWSLVLYTSSGKEVWKDLRTGMLWSDVFEKTNWCKASGNSQNQSPTLSVDCMKTGGLGSVCAGKTLYALASEVSWRLPTRSDFLQADLNGLRFTLPVTRDEASWTATLDSASADRSKAWVYDMKQGTLSSKALTSENTVRCIGAPLI